MKILLVIPRYNLTNEVSYQYEFPLGLAYVSSSIKKAGHEVDCLNLNHLAGATKDLVFAQLNKNNYDVVCSGHTGIGYAVIEKIVQASREHVSRPKVILGGCLITSEPELMLDALGPDFEVIGEGENTIVKLLEAIEKNSPFEKIEDTYIDDFFKVDGIGFKALGKNYFTNPRKPIEDLDSLPPPDFEGFSFGEYVDNRISESLYGEFDSPRIYPLLASRGCVFNCTFCYHSVGKYRQRSIEKVMEELKYAFEKWKINKIEIYDDLFSFNRERLFDFCAKIKELIKTFPWTINWACQLSVINVDKKLVETLKDAGCNIIGFGFESYSQEVLDSMRKPITPAMIDNAVNLCKEVNIGMQGNFIFGDVAETKETAKITLDYWKKIRRGQVLIGFIQPYPGSAIYKRCVEKGIIKDKLDFIKNKIAHTNWLNMTEKMTDKEILQLKKEILNARREYAYYLIPEKIEQIGKQRYNLHKICPFCNKEQIYQNCFIKNKLYYFKVKSCRSCNEGFFLCSKLYKFTMDYYNQLDFFRRSYLYIRDKTLKERI